LHELAEELSARGKLELEEALIDASFINSLAMSGGQCRTRTCDLLLVRQAL
jgi:hypothetical protein